MGLKRYIQQAMRLRSELRTNYIRGEVTNKSILRWANGDHLNLLVSINGCPVCNSWFGKVWSKLICDLDRLSSLIVTVSCPDCSCPIRAKVDPPLWGEPVEVPEGRAGGIKWLSI